MSKRTTKETPHVSISSRGAEHIASAVIGADRLSTRDFAAQREAHRRADARWDGGGRVWVCPRARLVRLLAELRAIPIDVRVSDELVLAPTYRAIENAKVVAAQSLVGLDESVKRVEAKRKAADVECRCGQCMGTDTWNL